MERSFHTSLSETVHKTGQETVQEAREKTVQNPLETPLQNSGQKTLILACGALAKEIVTLQKQLGQAADLQCLPAELHNRPAKIVPGLKAILDSRAQDYDRVLIGYGDCGTGGGLDALLKNYPNAVRLPGAHCYAVFAGLNRFDAMMEEELGTFFLTDYIVRHFETLIIKGMGLDRFPELKNTYFKHYKKVVFLAQTHDPDLQAQAKESALRLGLDYDYRYVGYGNLASAISFLSLDTPLTAGRSKTSERRKFQSENLERIRHV